MKSVKTNRRAVVGPIDASTEVSLAANAHQLRTFVFILLGLLVCFAKPLYDLTCFAFNSELFSYIVLVPFISVYLAWSKRDEIGQGSGPVRLAAIIPFALGAGALFSSMVSARSGLVRSQADSLALLILSFYLLVVAAFILCLSRQALRSVAFPIGFLIFIVPFPGFLIDWVAAALQHSSAMSAQALFALTGLSAFRQGLVFQLPGIRLEVAPECSGIHSTVVLFITSLVAGYLFLQAPLKRTALALAVIPLGIVRNAVRICTIGHLCVHLSPDMIDSPIHHRGGPLFFVASLIPLFLLLYLLRRTETKRACLSQSN